MVLINHRDLLNKNIKIDGRGITGTLDLPTRPRINKPLDSFFLSLYLIYWNREVGKKINRRIREGACFSFRRLNENISSVPS